ncbi:MAG: type II toxin-antitoxin system PemK/MazF family toxin [Trueperaceae bacterium]|nr:type II toxin-antitoxin system PemK/MazF family toxin [Trueperaceae bacterium]
MRRGDIYYASFDPTRGSETNKLRPVIIVSNDALNIAVENLQRGVITVIPLTSNVEKVASYQVFLPLEASGLSKDSKAQTEQVRALAFERFLPEIKGTVPASYMAQIDEALKLHFSLI